MVFERLPEEGWFARLKLVWADMAPIGGELIEWVRGFFGWVLEIVRRPEGRSKGFVVLPKRWG